MKAVILSDNKQTFSVIKSYAEEFGEFEVVDASYDEILSFDKSVLIVDLSENCDLKLDFISRITQNTKNCRVLVLSDNPSVDLMVKSMRFGAKEFAALPVIKSEIMDAFSRLIIDKKELKKCKVITVFSNKGGIGKTSIASNLALELAKTSKEKVALIDLNFQLGDITTFLDIKPSFDISYFLQNIDRLDDNFLLSTLEQYKSTSLYVLADPPFLKQADEILPKQITKLLDVLKNTFSYIVIDTETGFGAKNIAALTSSDFIFMIAVANLPVLRSTQRCLELFEKLGIDLDKVKLILNRFMENDEISEHDVEKLLARKIYTKIPNNYFTLMSAVNKGIPVCDLKPDSNIAQSYGKLALKLSDNILKDSVANNLEAKWG